MIKFLSSICLILFYNFSVAQTEIVEKLPKGNFPVGFNSTVAFDYAQNYPYCLDSSAPIKKYPKPLIINIWYPAITTASSKQMAYKEYFAFYSPDKNIVQWINHYKDYTENTAIEEWFDKKKSELNSTERLVLNSFLNSKTLAVKNATAAKGKFPLVIYHQGAGASFEDNAILCERLASQGYIVIGCSFQSDNGKSLATGRYEGSLKDAGFLLSFARTLQNVDWMHMAMIGHSLGAQAVNYIASQGNMPFDAMISLETTQEQHIGKGELWRFVPYVTENAEKVKVVFLFASKPYAIHDIADKMINANRYYLTIPDIAHNDFISQGIQKKYLIQSRDTTPEAVKDFRLANEKYSALCGYLLTFLDDKLKGEQKKWRGLLANTGLQLAHTFFLEAMPRGSRTAIYNTQKQMPPTPRELKFIIQAGKLDTAVYLLHQFWHKDSTQPIYEPCFVYAMAADHLLHIDTPGAIKLYSAYKEMLGNRADKQFELLIELYSLFNKKQYIDSVLDKLLVLSPANEAEVKRLKRIYLK